MSVYFAANAGSDAADGATPATAWQTVERVNKATLAPGDTVLFAGGDTFADSALMPSTSGAPGAPITFAHTGKDRAHLPLGAWFVDVECLTFDGLTLPGGLQGGNDSGHIANRIVVQNCVIDRGGASIGLLSNGDQWQIVGNTIRNTGDSGLRLEGDDYLVCGNTIRATGLDSSIPYGKHAVYLLASNARILDNTIRGFSASGVSPRRRNSTIHANQISGGPIGIGFYQYDGGAGLSRWTFNDFGALSTVGIWVSRSDKGGPTAESFQIDGNTYDLAAGVPQTNLSLTTGQYL